MVKCWQMRTMLILMAFLVGASFALPLKTYLPVPFLCQAPYADWSQPWQDGCEEACIIMAINYAKPGLGTGGLGTGAEEILKLVKFQEENYGGHYDLNAKQIAKLLKDYYKYDKVEVRYDIEVEDIKQELTKGNVVIAPMAGRLLGNPYYTPPGPAYHNILFKGYDDRSGEFIANDCGTKRGRNYRYKYEVAYNAIHDWTGKKKTIVQGRKAIVVVRIK